MSNTSRNTDLAPEPPKNGNDLIEKMMNAQAAISPSIAVLLPCHNEELAIAAVVKNFKNQLPTATIYVFDNASSDDTGRVAAAAGAHIFHVPEKGKGNVIRRMFADIDADIYVMCDGDGTYEVEAIPELINALINDNLDMVVGARKAEDGAHRRGHALGNEIFNTLISRMFGQKFTDVFSGFRVFSRRFVKSFPALSTGFETETEMSIHALELKLPVIECNVKLTERVEGSVSKLNTVRDSLKILWTIMLFCKEVRPFWFFSTTATLLALTSVLLGLPVIAEFIETGLVPRFPTAILATGIMILGFMSFICGLILDSVRRGRWEAKRASYLSFPSVVSVIQNKQK